MTKREARKFCRQEWQRFLTSNRPVQLLGYLASFLNRLKPGTRLLISMPLRDELNYLGLLGRRGLRLYAPRTLQKDIEFRCYEPEDPELSKTEPGYRGVPGPSEKASLLKLPLSAKDQVIVPMLGLGTDGTRLGRGGGYYDRWRERFSVLQTVALAPAVLSQLDFPAEPHDLRVNQVITEEGVLKYF